MAHIGPAVPELIKELVLNSSAGIAVSFKFVTVALAFVTSEKKLFGTRESNMMKKNASEPLCH